ncbi:MAG: DNA-methyltransferase [Microbacteriaceae bacterium]
MPRIIHGDALAELARLPDRSVDAVVTDPPYGLAQLPARKVAVALAHWLDGDDRYVPSGGRGFMGEAWDRFVPPPAVWRQCLRVLKPGGHLAVFAGTRTQDLMGLSLRLAGAELRDALAWAHGQGMPKGQNLGRTDPRLAGQSTALKPAVEPILLARAPLAERTALRNAQVHGTGGLRVDATRIPHRSEADLAESVGKNQHGKYGSKHGATNIYGDYSSLGVQSDYDGSRGRFPANFALAHAAGCRPLGWREAATTRHDPAVRPAGGIGVTGHAGQAGLAEFSPRTEPVEARECAPGCQVAELDRQSGSTEELGGASRFFYCAKPTAAERPEYIDAATGERVFHRTVKPVGLMRWLVRLLAARGGTVLDPFAGSGTTVEAALREGVAAIGIEREARYLPLIDQRVHRARRG